MDEPDTDDDAVLQEGGTPAVSEETTVDPALTGADVPIPAHPLLYGTVAVLVVLSLVSYGLTGEGVVVAFAAAVLAVLAAIDLEHRLLPNRIIFPSLAIVLAGRLATDPDSAAEWLLAGPAVAAFLAMPLLVRRDAVGLGDVKLGLLLGAVAGWSAFGAIVVASLAMLPVALAMLVRDGTVRGAVLPFGPFLAFGTLVVLYASA